MLSKSLTRTKDSQVLIITQLQSIIKEMHPDQSEMHKSGPIYITLSAGPHYLDLESHLKQNGHRISSDQHDHHRYNLFNASSALLE